jgi:hypothetical protein
MLNPFSTIFGMHDYYKKYSMGSAMKGKKVPASQPLPINPPDVTCANILLKVYLSTARTKKV